MGNLFEDVKEFHKATDTPVYSTPFVPTRDRLQLRDKLMTEEIAEMFRAFERIEFLVEDQRAVPKELLVEFADGCIDAIVTIVGSMWELGLVPQLINDEIHRSNMSKVPGMIKRSDGKILKGPSYIPPDLMKVLWPEG